MAQLCLTYTYSFEDKKYKDYVCILSVLAQVAIDNAKRRFDIDLTEEIDRIKKDMNVKDNGYPAFWMAIRKGFNKKRVNYSLDCPMNYIYDIKIDKFRSNEETLPMSLFFIKHELEADRRKSKVVEELIQKYSLDLLNYQSEKNDDSSDDYLLLRSDFDDLIQDIKNVYISKSYTGLMSWLIDRAFLISPSVISNNKNMTSKIDKNKSLLLKVLYNINKDELLKCFKIGENIVHRDNDNIQKSLEN